MPRRKKSFSQIIDQADRIASNPRATQRRIDIANIAADRYTDNIMKSRKFTSGGRGAYDIPFSQRAYMGLSAG